MLRLRSHRSKLLHKIETSLKLIFPHGMTETLRKSAGVKPAIPRANMQLKQPNSTPTSIANANMFTYEYTQSQKRDVLG